MEAARRLAFAALLILPAALVLGLSSCADRPATSPVAVAEAAPLPPPPAAPVAQVAAKPAPAETDQKPTPEEVAEFQKPAPK
jgi:hypothetical protein